jgi:hypothetical protein
LERSNAKIAVRRGITRGGKIVKEPPEPDGAPAERAGGNPKREPRPFRVVEDRWTTVRHVVESIATVAAGHLGVLSLRHIRKKPSRLPTRRRSRRRLPFAGLGGTRGARY